MLWLCHAFQSATREHPVCMAGLTRELIDTLHLPDQEVEPWRSGPTVSAPFQI